MRQTRVSRALRALSVVALAACGGSGDGGVVPPAPVPVASVAVTPASAQLELGGTSQLTATTKDAAGLTLTGRSVAWASANLAVASVSTTGLVTGLGAGQVEVTATSEGRSGASSITVALPSFAPSTTTSIQGTQRFARVTVPAGVIVTASGALTLTAQDSLIVRGTIAGDCVPLTLTGGTVVVEGDVRNTCSVDPETDQPPVLRIISGSTMELGPGVTESSGDVVVTNDTTLIDTDFPIAPRHAAHAFMANAVIRGNCRTSGRTWRFAQRNPGSSGQFGGNGRPGRTFRMDCAGDLILANGATIQAQHGGDGGAGTHASAVAASARGGGGGEGGRVRLRATGSIIVAGLNNEIRTGRGGAGGSATATGQPDPGPTRAASATATGGNGGSSGLATLLAGGSISSAPGGGGGLTILVGDGGVGGAAISDGASGLHAAERGAAAQHGGNATATGGAGGSSPNKQLVATGSVALNVGVSGGNAGTGGAAIASGGLGGNGNEASPPGADGGRMEATGGTGGESLLLDAAGARVGNGGDGGRAVLLNGHGGHGWSDCAPGNRKPGGAGGRGGDGFGRRGAAGTGRTPGTPGLMVATGVSRGGNGGNGQGPGVAGQGGNDAVQQPADVTGSFAPGVEGQPCGPIPLAVIQGVYRLTAMLQSMTGNACPTGFFTPTIINPGPIAVTVSSQTVAGEPQPEILGQVRIQSSFLVVGDLNGDGSWTGTGSGPLLIDGMTFSALETIKGVWREKTGGGVELNSVGEIRYQLSGAGGTCLVLYKPATYTKLPG